MFRFVFVPLLRFHQYYSGVYVPPCNDGIKINCVNVNTKHVIDNSSLNCCLSFDVCLLVFIENAAAAKDAQLTQDASVDDDDDVYVEFFILCV